MNKLLWTDRERINEILNKKDLYPFSDYLNDFLLKCNYKDSFYRLMYLHLKLSLPDQMLVKVDRMSMANSIETRAPFLDFRLIEFLVNVDKNVKMNGYQRKTILRNTIGKQLPQDLLKASKKGFSVPIREWFKNRDFDNRLNAICNYSWNLNSDSLRKTIKENTNGKIDNGNFIWMLIVLKRFFENLD
jgi:asparagine synthase (glutamine-hydrolysing)